MSLEAWAKNGWLQPHQTSRQQLGDLLAIVDRDLADAAAGGLSQDCRFGIAYNAALKLCTMLLYAQGHRPEKNLAHYRNLQALPLILGAAWDDDADYLDTCRAKRNTAEYDAIGQVSTGEADELIAFPKSSVPPPLPGCRRNTLHSLPSPRSEYFVGQGGQAVSCETSSAADLDEYLRRDTLALAH